MFCTAVLNLTFVDGGSPTAGLLSYPSSVMVDSLGVTFADSGSSTVRRISPATTSQSRSPSQTMTVTPTQSRSATQYPSALTAVLYGVAGGDLFGQSVALSADGGSLVVGAKLYASSSGGAFTFACSITGSCGSAPVTTLTGSGGSYGAAVTLTGNGSVVAVGAPDDTNGGKVYVYSCPAGDATCSTSARSTLNICCGFSGVLFGYAVAFSSDGTILAVGMPGWAANSLLVFPCSGGGICGAASSSSFGGILVNAIASYSGSGLGANVAACRLGNTAFVVAGWPGSNIVPVYRCNSSACGPSPDFTLSGPSGSSFGSSVAASGDCSTIVVGASAFSGFGAALSYSNCKAGGCAGYVDATVTRMHD